jgi:hypothetical protein
LPPRILPDFDLSSDPCKARALNHGNGDEIPCQPPELENDQIGIEQRLNVIQEAYSTDTHFLKEPTHDPET